MQALNERLAQVTLRDLALVVLDNGGNDAFQILEEAALDQLLALRITGHDVANYGAVELRLRDGDGGAEVLQCEGARNEKAEA
jgi:hypothetical protein